MRKITISEVEVSTNENGEAVSQMTVDSENVSGAFILDAMVALCDTACQLTQIPKAQVVLMFIDAMNETFTESKIREESGEPINEVESSID